MGAELKKCLGGDTAIKPPPAAAKEAPPSAAAAAAAAPEPVAKVETPAPEAPAPAPAKCPLDGMCGERGLPEAMSAETVATVDETAGVVAPHALEITKGFYGEMIESLPQVVLTMFNPAHNVPISTHQPEALAASVVAYASNIKDLSPLLVPGGAVDAINHRHCALEILPDHYPVVHDHLMWSVAKVLGPKLGGEVPAPVVDAWSEAVRFLAKVCIDKEEALYAEYAKRPGGWRGRKDFKVTEIKDAGTDIKSFTFEPVEPQDAGFDFTPGQYLTVKVDPNGDGLTAPRHYTTTSPPGEKYLQCTTKKVAGGVVSTYMHEALKVGDTVKLTPPYGVFTLDQELPTGVLVSAGIGVTPMVNFARALGDKTALVVHVDKTEAAHAFKAEFEPYKTLFKYTDGGARPSVASVAKETIEAAGTGHCFYICGPPAWMKEMQAELLTLGAKKVMCEVFGSQLATGCPFAASAPEAAEPPPAAVTEPEPEAPAPAKCPLDGMCGERGLPEAMSAETVATVDETAGVVAPHALEITKGFYGEMIESLPQVVLTMFNPAHNVPISTHQPEALAASVVAYASNIKDLSPLLVPGGAVDAINHRHCALEILPDHYPVVHDHLMWSVAKVLGPKLGGEVPAPVVDAWSEAVRFLAKVCIDKEEALYAEYAKRPGGWRGRKDFKVTEIKDAGTDIKSFTFEPVEPQDAGFDFTPGQYLTVKVDPNGDGLTAPRHYTTTSPPGEKYLQCTTKKVAGGVVSTYMHEALKVGDTVKLTPPYGVFTLDQELPTGVLVSAGIGVTPMVNFARALGDKTALVVHVDKTEAAHAFKAEFEPYKTLFKYTDGGARPSVASVAKETIEAAGTGHCFYICGPPAWMKEMQAELLTLGAKKVMCEVFGSQLATGCPFAASAPEAPASTPDAYPVAAAEPEAPAPAPEAPPRRMSSYIKELKEEAPPKAASSRRSGGKSRGSGGGGEPATETTSSKRASGNSARKSGKGSGKGGSAASLSRVPSSEDKERAKMAEAALLGAALGDVGSSKRSSKGSARGSKKSAGEPPAKTPAESPAGPTPASKLDA